MTHHRPITQHDLITLGWQTGPAVRLAMRAAKRAIKRGMAREEVLEALRSVHEDPAAWRGHHHFGQCAREVERGAETFDFSKPRLREEPLPFPIWGEDGIEAGALDQMRGACSLPITVAGALMPDAHQGYGVPIGGVLATRGAVIPYAVGVDIACRMRMTVVDLEVAELDRLRERLRHALVRETAFGVGAEFEKRRRRSHEVMDDPAWSELPLPNRDRLIDTAWKQLGSSGSGNHFVEFGEFEAREAVGSLVSGRRYVALLSHSGSRGFGARVAEHFSRLAAKRCSLPGALKHIAWLTLDSEEGHDYWEAMELAGRYAAANHALIHRHVIKTAGLREVFTVENHHNFAWRERHGGEEVVVHRKGATPAGRGTLGIIPGSMATPGYLVRGRGSAAGLDSASHGAGRRMSRRAANDTIPKSDWLDALARARVELIAGGRDEAPQAYKSIEDVMEAQGDLVEIMGEFHPRLVLMSDEKTKRDI